MPSMTIISVGAGKDGREKVEAMTIEPTAAFRTARKFVADYCIDCPLVSYAALDESGHVRGERIGWDRRLAGCDAEGWSVP